MLFETIEHPLDLVAVSVGLLIERWDVLAARMRLDHRAYAMDEQLLTIVVAVVAGVAQQAFGRRRIDRNLHQRQQLLAVGGFATCDQEGDGSALSIRSCVNF